MTERRRGAQNPSGEPARRRWRIRRIGRGGETGVPETSTDQGKRRGGIWKRFNEGRARRKQAKEERRQRLQDIIFGLERMGQIDQVGAPEAGARDRILKSIGRAAREAELDASRREVSKAWLDYKKKLAQTKRTYRHGDSRQG